MNKISTSMKIFIPIITLIFISSTSLNSNLRNECAQFFAGKSINYNSKLNKVTKTRYYKSYKDQISKGWNKFQKPNIDKIKEWWKKHVPSRYDKTILYPFSGPDITNAITFFPNANKYILFGLEPPGAIPTPHEMRRKNILDGLSGLKKSLNTIFRVNFFRTKGMKENLSYQSFNGVTGLLMFFLAINDYEIVNVKKIAIDSKSTLSPAKKDDYKIDWQNPPKSWIPGVEISFRKKGKKVQRVRYYMLNVINYSLTHSSPNFIPYLAKEGPFTTIIKSASYLMHNDKTKFTKIRRAILENSNYVIQDDSGIPLRYFTSGNWKVKFHGSYDKPIGLFSHRMQVDLKDAMKKYSTGKLPFSYGYNPGKGASNLMTANKKQ